MEPVQTPIAVIEKGNCSTISSANVGMLMAHPIYTSIRSLNELCIFMQNHALAMSRLMLKSAKRASLIENLRSLRGLGKMRVR